MDASDLRIFEAVARLGGMNRAAAALNTVQSNVTARIRALEEQLGVQLFRRTSRGVSLTAAGERLLSYSVKMARLLDEARRAAQDDGTPRGQLIHDVVLMIDRSRSGRSKQPSAAILDSQSVKAPAAGGSRGFDGAKSPQRGALSAEIVGRKRHIAVDADGRLLMVNLTTADISDSAGAQAVLDALRRRWPWVKHLFADGAYDRRQFMDKAAFLDFTAEIVRRTDVGFKILPRRWVVERTFGWLTRYRRLVRDYEARIDVLEAFIYAAMTNMIIRRIAHP
jgi:transposase/molybdenum-dependent DNA-binding transcriptional regulator ModE